MSAEKPTPLIILGMHRSGTSCLAGTLEQAGVCLGEVSNYNKYNKKGNKENSKTMALNNKILEYNDASWDKPPVNLTWTKDHELEALSLIKEFETNCLSPYWGFKDPRVLVTLPFWSKLLPQAKYIATYRNPDSVAKSLNSRAEASIDHQTGLDLWASYNQQLIGFYQKSPFPIISFDLSAKAYSSQLSQIFRTLNLAISEDTAFFDHNLRNQKNKTEKLSDNTQINALYEKLQHLYL